MPLLLPPIAAGGLIGEARADRAAAGPLLPVASLVRGSSSRRAIDGRRRVSVAGGGCVGGGLAPAWLAWAACVRLGLRLECMWAWIGEAGGSGGQATTYGAWRYAAQAASLRVKELLVCSAAPFVLLRSGSAMRQLSDWVSPSCCSLLGSN
ncbi:hypothetical protein ZWY2020_034698 [Hordeum vulgare]|nr:hypothetical protein ZWY2020_034698 [Hordeum vulgare]